MPCEESIHRRAEHAKGADVRTDRNDHRVEVVLPDGEGTPGGVREILTELGYQPEEIVRETL